MKFLLKLLLWLITPFFLTLSLLPFSVLHALSSAMAWLMHRVWGYRLKVVRENLRNSFPEKSAEELSQIETQFYRNFSDLVFESIKAFTISEKELLSRYQFQSADLARSLFQQNKSVTGISSHLGNWEWNALVAGLIFEHGFYAAYKPLKNEFFNDWVVRSRMRFGTFMIPFKKIRDLLLNRPSRPILLGLLSDQSPHDYSKAFEVQFLNQKTYVVTGPGVLTVQNNFVPVWGWVKRVGRSRYEWGMELIDTGVESVNWSDADRAQIQRISEQFSLSHLQASQALLITQEFNRRLEVGIRAAPADWLWSHRRWKSR